MAEHNILSRAGRMLTALGIGTGLADGEEGVVRLSETLTPVIDMWNRPDLAFTRGDRLCTALATLTAGGAATTTFVGIKNNSANILAIVENIFAVANNDFFVGLLVNSAAAIVAAAEVGPAVVRDSRLALGSGLSTGRLTIIRSNPASPGSGKTAIGYGTNRTMYFGPIIVAPGYSCLVETITENVALTAAIQYTERLILPGELLRP